MSLLLEGEQVADTDRRRTRLDDGTEVWLQGARFFVRAPLAPRGMDLRDGQLVVGAEPTNQGHIQVPRPLTAWVQSLTPSVYKAIERLPGVRLMDGVWDCLPRESEAVQALALARSLQPPLLVAVETAVARIRGGEGKFRVDELGRLMSRFQRRGGGSPVPPPGQSKLLSLAYDLELGTRDPWREPGSTGKALKVMLSSPLLHPKSTASYLLGLPSRELASAIATGVPRSLLASVVAALARGDDERSHNLLGPLSVPLREDPPFEDLVEATTSLAKRLVAPLPKELEEPFQFLVGKLPPRVALTVIEACLEAGIEVPKAGARVATEALLAASESEQPLVERALRCLQDDQLTSTGAEVLASLLTSADAALLERALPLASLDAHQTHASILVSRLRSAQGPRGSRHHRDLLAAALERLSPRRAARLYVDFIEGEGPAVSDGLKGLERVGTLNELDAVRRRRRGLTSTREIRDLALVAETAIRGRRGPTGLLSLTADAGELSLADVGGGALSPLQDEGALSPCEEPADEGPEPAAGSRLFKRFAAWWVRR